MVFIKSYKEYSVTIADDGAIFVKTGDWVSKYSAAIHQGDTGKINEYGRLQGGKIIPLRDPNKIRSGERIYHIPTYIKKKMEKLEKNLKEAIDKGKRLQRTIESFKKERSIDQKKIVQMEKEVESLEEQAEDRYDVCDDMYSCMVGGMLGQRKSWEAQAIKKEIQGMREVHATSESLQQRLEERLQVNIQRQEKLQTLVRETKRTLSGP